MTAGDIDPFKQSGESDEQYNHRLEEFFLAENWMLRFRAHTALLRGLGNALAEEQDPNRVMDLIEQHQSSLNLTFGAAALNLRQGNIIAELQQFEVDFGSQD